MGYVDPKNKTNVDGLAGDDADTIEDLLSELGINISDVSIKKIEKEHKPNKLDPKL